MRTFGTSTVVAVDLPDGSQVEVYADVDITPGTPARLYGSMMGPEEPASFEATITKVVDDQNKVVPLTPEVEALFEEEAWTPDPDDDREPDYDDIGD